MLDLTLLMKQAGQGDKKSFGQLAQHLSGYLYNLCYKWLQSETEAEDALQEVLIKLWKTAPKWEAKAEVKTYVYRIAYNHCLDKLRSAKKVVELVDEHGIEPTQVDKIYQDQRQAHLKERLDALPESQKTAVMLFYYEQMKQKEIAEVMAINVKAVESLLSRAKKKLQEQVNPIYKEA